MIDDLRQMWKRLEDAAPADHGLLVTRIGGGAGFSLYTALLQPDARRALSVEVEQVRVPATLKFPECAGIEVRVEPLQQLRQTRFVIASARRQYNALFTVLIREALPELLASSDGAAVLQSLASAVARWQRFLSRVPTRALGQEAQRGLYGELWALQNHLLPRIGPRASVAAWAGPLGGRQDFQFTSVAFEIKTYSGNLPARVMIADLSQLDPPEGVRLMLHAILLDNRAAGGTTLPQLVASVRSSVLSLEPDSVDDLDARLTAAGYNAEDESHYGDASYHVRSESSFEVVDGFPRLREADVPAGVGSVTYSLDLSACVPFAAANPWEAVVAETGDV